MRAAENMLRAHRRLALACLALLAAALIASAQALTASSGSLCPGTFGSFKVGHWPAACWRPYGPSSPFNVRIPANPRLAPESARIVAFMLARNWKFEGSHGRMSIDAGGSRPVYWPTSHDPLVRVHCRVRHSCRHVSSVRIPPAAQPQSASDAHMTVVEQGSRWEYDFWQAGRAQGGSMVTSAASRIRIGPNIGSGLGGDAEAADLGLLGGLVRAPELAAGHIEHALAMTAPCVQRNDVWPAPAWGRGDATCEGQGAGPHFGSLLQLNMSDAEIAASGAPRWQRTLMTAMAHYGIYVVDTGNTSSREISLLNEDDQSFTSFGRAGAMQRFVASLGGGTITGAPLDLSRFRVIAPCVPRRTC
jgi:hypothetical protein